MIMNTEYEALQCDICYCRIVRKYIRNKYKYYVQIVFKGNPPIKVDMETGKIKHGIGTGDVGLDIGTSTIAIASESDVKILELADRIQSIENQKKKLLRKMDRSRRIGQDVQLTETIIMKMELSRNKVIKKLYGTNQNIISNIKMN